jgi:hypothetical protein
MAIPAGCLWNVHLMQIKESNIVPEFMEVDALGRGHLIHFRETHGLATSGAVVSFLGRDYRFDFEAEEIKAVLFPSDGQQPEIVELDSKRDTLPLKKNGRERALSQ